MDGFLDSSSWNNAHSFNPGDLRNLNNGIVKPAKAAPIVRAVAPEVKLQLFAPGSAKAFIMTPNAPSRLVFGATENRAWLELAVGAGQGPRASLRPMCLAPALAGEGLASNNRAGFASFSDFAYSK